MTSLYRLDQIETADGAKQTFDGLPGPAIALLSGLAIAWICIVGYVAAEEIKKKKQGNR